ncbi:MAG: aminotransferase class V-fold PLP-dependent enzyme [Acidobacteria bacterium]|nr:aminotransferase class V-fold PLP-dependent enzyme [Acidobacteriota bacterium]MCA1651930.1 aminotransferase class V-fold PLP-dependent enzyme [Acidobacteriota bacterium]
MNRRDFSRLFALGGSAALLARDGTALTVTQAPRPAPAAPDERFWKDVRDQFVMPSGYVFLNAANICPSPLRVLDAYFDGTRAVERDPSSQNRQKTKDGREAARRALAAYLRVTPEEIVITRNTSESNNLVSSGLDLKAGDEVLIFSDNHPSNHAAWHLKAERFGFSVRAVEQVNPHPGADYYLEAFRRAITPKTRVVAFTHVTASVGDVLPAAELCRLARERGALSLVDGAQSFGVLDVNVAEMQPDFFTGSAHKWPCGPKETGVLFVNKAVHDRIKPSIVSLYPGDVGISRTLEAFGQRDEPAMIGFAEALALQTTIGRAAIERRSRELAHMLIAGLSRISGVKVWTSIEPDRAAAVVSFLPGDIDPRKLHQVLYETERIVCATRTGADRGGLRFSPHFYNLQSDISRTIEAVQRHVRSGV